MNYCISKKVLINILNFWGFAAFCFTYRIAHVVCVQGNPSQNIKQFEKITKQPKKNPSKFKLSSEHIRSHLHLVSKRSWLVTPVPALQRHTATSWYSLTVHLCSTENYKRFCRAFLSKLKLTSHLWMRIKAAYSTAMA